MASFDCGRAPELLRANPLPPPPHQMITSQTADQGGNAAEPQALPKLREIELAAERLQEKLEMLPDEDIDRLCEKCVAKGLVEVDGRWGRKNRIKALVACNADPEQLG